MSDEQHTTNDPSDRNTTDRDVGRVVVGYKLLERIGEGEGSRVYMAAPRGGGGGPVALKLLARLPDRGRRIPERGVARLEHPNIGRLLRAGTTSDGQSYVVSELIRGVPITAYAVANELPERELLALLMPVAEALEYAHRHGLVHGRLTASNVLVTLHDGRPVPKVVDWAGDSEEGVRGDVRALGRLLGELFGATADARLGPGQTPSAEAFIRALAGSLRDEPEQPSGMATILRRLGFFS